MSSIVTIIVPAYNQAQYLSECLDSIVHQSIRSWECIISDDGSTDTTTKVASEYTQNDIRFKYIFHPNQGLSAARNRAIAIATTDFILPLDADDRLDPLYLEIVLQASRDNPNAKVIYTGCQFFGLTNERMDIKGYSFGELLKGNIFPVTALYRRLDYLSMSGYDETMRDGWEDWDFWLSFLGPEDFVHMVDEPLFFYRKKNESLLTSITPTRAYQLRKYIYNKHFELYRRYFEDPINLTYQLKEKDKIIRDLQKKDLLGRLHKKAEHLRNRITRRPR